MCGIVGEIRLDGKDLSRDPGGGLILKRSLDILAPRGPDGGEIYRNTQVSFGHRILRIYDQSQASDQPMVDRALGLAITFNGAIYNHKELRRELEQCGYVFKTKSDTEVLLKAYDRWGREHPHVFLSKLNGMFAFAIHDQKHSSTFLVRDRLGEKPLYYSKQKDRLLFASTPQALFPFGRIDDSINAAALDHYTQTGAFSYGPDTLLNGIKKFPNAHFMVIESGKDIRIKQYWEPRYEKECKEKTENECIYDTETALFDHIEHCQTGDNQKVGLFLSGGVDSILLLAGMHARGQTDIPTFSYGYEGLPPEYDHLIPDHVRSRFPDLKTDEFDFSDPVAKQFQTNHTKIVLSHADQLAGLDEAISSMNEPYPIYDLVARKIMARVAKKVGISVVLGGEGADEVFAGYPQFLAATQALHLRDATDLYVQSFLKTTEHNKTYAAVSNLFEAATRNGLSGLQSSLYAHLMGFQPTINFGRIECGTASEGVELRSPFVGNGVMSAAFFIPDALKVRNNNPKHILKAIAKRYVSADLIDVPKRWSPNPALTYLPGEFGDHVRDFLVSRDADNGMFNPAALRKFSGNVHAVNAAGLNDAFYAYVMTKWLSYNRKLKAEVEYANKAHIGFEALHL